MCETRLAVWDWESDGGWLGLESGRPVVDGESSSRSQGRRADKAGGGPEGVAGWGEGVCVCVLVLHC